MRIIILHASAGHGHAKAAEAVKEGFARCGVADSEVTVLDALQETPAWFRKGYTSSYYFSVKHLPQVWGSAYALMDQDWFYDSIGARIRKFVNDFAAERLVRRMAGEAPEAIVCTHFLSPEVIGRAKIRGRLNSRLITVVTDFMPHRFWINPGTDHYWVMSEEGKRALESRAVPSNKITAGGIPISLKFRPQNKKPEARRKEGLEADRFTLLITSGSFGLGPTEELMKTLREFGERIQAIVVCGKNQDLLQALEKESYPFRLRLYGFVSHMDELMEASDLVIAKPGGATTSECLAKGVPMVVVEPIPGQEAGNAGLLKERNAAFFLSEPGDIRVILKGILDYPGVLIEKQNCIRRLAKPDAAVDLARFVLHQIKEP